MDDQQPPLSQGDPPIALEPIPAHILAANETSRRDANQKLGPCRCGCPEVDDYVLLGGLERGSVVGVSAEREDFGVAFAVQVLAKGLRDGSMGKALVITPRPAGEILAALRNGIRAALDEPSETQTRSHLDKVMLSCVFDLNGVWEVLADLDRRPSPPSLEIQDSEDEDISPPRQQDKPYPDIIIITHVSSILASLFTHRSSPAAHSALQMLSSHLRHLSRTLPSAPLVLLLNSTTTPPPGGVERSSSKPLDPTLRSVFNPPAIPGYRSAPASRKNKPTFGLVFTQMLDLHVLCTWVPRSSEDADAAFAPQHEGQQQQQHVRYVVVVEVLLDEMGVWEEGRKRGSRRSREQRWGAVEQRHGGRIVDAFDKDKGGKVYGM